MAGLYSEDLWKEAFISVQQQFHISSLLPEQQQAMEYFFAKNNIFINLPTGYGKSLIFQSLPIVADIMFSQPRGSNLMVVISPLKALMEDQISYLTSVGVPAIAIADEEDPEIIQQVLNGCYVVVYGSPECILSTKTWRGIFADPGFQEMLLGVAIDEAHVVVQWGLGAATKAAFRKWYGCLGEMKSLVPANCPIVILTATATKTTKQLILDTLQMSVEDVKMIEQSPDKPNLLYLVEYLDKSCGLEVQFGHLIKELKTSGINVPRTLIYCQTRKQCAILYRMFQVYLGGNFFHGGALPQNRLVEMYHSGTPATVKEHICKNMSTIESHMRVLICTIAFGMGVNCKGVRRVIHFGPLKSVEMYVQECGRAGRDGLPSTCILLYNGLLSYLCDNDMKQYLQLDGCRRKWLMSHFGCEVDHSYGELHECCDFCHTKCNCGTCENVWSLQLNEYIEDPPEMVIGKVDQPRSQLSRAVTTADRELLRQKLWSFRRQMFRKVNVATMVSCPNILLEFNAYHIEQVVENCSRLFTLENILCHVEIWRHCYAAGIQRLIKETFGDITVEEPEESFDMDTTEYSDWGHVRDDSSLLSMFDTHDMEHYDFLMESQETNASESSM